MLLLCSVKYERFVCYVVNASQDWAASACDVACGAPVVL
jgi:hypothetical protein